MAGQMPNMPQNSPQGQGASGNGSVPDHRLNEMMTELRALKNENLQLRSTLGTIHQQMVAPKAPQDQGPPKVFEDNVQQAIDKYLDYRLNQFANQKINPLQQQVETAYGNLYDRNDEIAFRTKYGADPKFQKYIPKMEEIRTAQLNQGKFVSREEALRLAFFEEEGRKAPEPKQVHTPEFDPVLNMYVHPGTKTPWMPGQPVQAPPQQQQQNPQQQAQQQQMPPQFPQQDPQQQEWPQQPPQQQQQQAYPNTYNGKDPSQNPYAVQNFSLPNQGFNAPAATNHSTKAAPLGENPSEEELAAFENSYGDFSF